jgi:hypothetical protein
LDVPLGFLTIDATCEDDKVLILVMLDVPLGYLFL